ncbi:MAG: hypothetical protein P1P65_07535 [Treponema sp.]
MTKHPKFFCENCKAEVRRDAMICPHCGRFFASVRCPACEFTGTHKEFKDGCPACGYAFNSDGQHSGAGTHKTAHTVQQESGGKRNDEDPLPLWVYGIVLSLAAIVFAIFFFNY